MCPLQKRLYVLNEFLNVRYFSLSQEFSGFRLEQMGKAFLRAGRKALVEFYFDNLLNMESEEQEAKYLMHRLTGNLPFNDLVKVADLIWIKKFQGHDYISLGQRNQWSADVSWLFVNTVM